MEAVPDYPGLLRLSQRMLAAARQEDWDELVALEKERARQVAQFQGADAATASGTESEETRDLIKQILACDEETRMLTERWMSEARDILTSLNAARKLKQAYR